MRVSDWSSGVCSSDLQARGAGVRRVVFVSSLKVMGEESDAAGFTENDTPRPQDAYAEAKLAAERLVLDDAPGPVVLRSPALYGRAIGGPVRHVLDLLPLAPVPLPPGCLGNRRFSTHPVTPPTTWPRFL